ncbi:MAG: S-layer homology domain-containing protein [Oscillospiraceae bacterium]|nr:S-layer homology domain-containing protein [Oscillospiraceae bacterium]
MTGTSATTFEPNIATTRSMIVTILYRLEGEPATDAICSFNDVADDAWYATAVAWAAENGIVKGYSAYEFAPQENITREQIASMLYRYAIYKGMDAVTLEENLLSFSDYEDISSYAVSAMNWAVGLNLITGIDASTLSPTESATRAQIAAILTRFVEATAG